MESHKDAMSMLYSPKAQLIMPEYGRNVQQMVNICMTIEDRAERNRCARTIINFMGNMFPYLRDVETFKHKLWDHLAIMSDFKLDIDYPFEVIKPEVLSLQPDKVPYNTKPIRYRHYGRNLENFIDYIGNHPEIKNHPELIRLIASHMKRCYAQFNKESVENIKIIADFETLSKGKIDFDKEMKFYDTRSNNNNRRYTNNNNSHSNRSYDNKRNSSNKASKE